MSSPADEVRSLMARYPTSPARTSAALDALGLSEQADAERAAADVLAGYGFTAEDIADGLADGGEIRVIAIRDDPEATP
jgi:hypothetical protein